MVLRPYHNEKEGIWYLFLPAYTEPGNVSVTVKPGVQTNLGQRLTDQPLKENFPVTVDTPFRSQEYILQVQQCTNLPTLSLDTEAGALDYIHRSMDHEKDVFVTMMDGDGNTLLQQVGTLSGRGNGTSGGNKRPYNLNFSEGVTVGPFQNISKLCLLAEAYDESKLRNSMAYFGGRELGVDYTSGYLHFNFFVNGEYRGLYGMTTKQEYEKHIKNDNIHGVFEYTFYPKENQFFTYPALKSFRVLYGNMDRIKWAVDDAYAAILSQDWELCAELLDFPSFAKKYAMDEFFGNYDMCMASQYYYIDDQDVIHCMLPWDYDWSMGSTFRYYDLPAERDIIAGRFPDFWVTYLLESPQFRAEIVQVMESAITQEWIQKLQTFMLERIPVISESLECDALRWSNEETPNLYGQKPDSAHLWELQEQFFRYFPARRDFLLEYYRDREQFCRISFQEERYAEIYVPRGAELQDYMGLTNLWDGGHLTVNIQGWQTENGQKPEEVGRVNQDITFLPIYGTAPPTGPRPLPEEKIPALDQIGLKLILVGTMAAAMLLMICKELSRHRSAKQKEKVTA